MQPIVKWAGGKRKLAPQIIKLLRIGECTERYVEPFLGGAAVFLAFVDEFPNGLYPTKYVLNDALSSLIRTYQTIVVWPNDVADELQTLLTSYFLPLDEFIDAEMQSEFRNEMYYQVRRCFNAGGELNDYLHNAGPERLGAHLAADFLFLNHACFNGLWRTNANGAMNVPHGKRKQLSTPTREELTAFAELFRPAILTAVDGIDVIADCGAGDAVYVDPPYDVSDDNVAEPAGSFTTYAGSFNWEDQVRLGDALVSAARRGARVVASNRATDRMIKLYAERGFVVEQIGVRHCVGAKGSRRGVVGEILAHRGPG